MNVAGDAKAMAAAIRVLLRVFTVDERRFPAAEGQLRYNGADFQAIRFIAEEPGCTGLGLAAFLGVAPTTAQSVIERLIERGFVAKSRSREDGRAVALNLTAEGEAIKLAIDRQDHANCEIMLKLLPSSARRAFIRNLEQVAQGVGESV